MVENLPSKPKVLGSIPTPPSHTHTHARMNAMLEGCTQNKSRCRAGECFIVEHLFSKPQTLDLTLGSTKNKQFKCDQAPVLNFPVCEPFQASSLMCKMTSFILKPSQLETETPQEVLEHRNHYTSHITNLFFRENYRSTLCNSKENCVYIL